MGENTRTYYCLTPENRYNIYAGNAIYMLASCRSINVDGGYVDSR